MADSRPAKGLKVEQWDDDFFTEYVQESRFKPYMGTDENSIIQLKEDLSKKKGDRITFALINRMRSPMLRGANMLEGNEDRMDSRSYKVTVDKARAAIRTTEMDEQRSAIDLREAARSVLMTKTMEDTRDLIIGAMGSVGVNSPIPYATASEANKNTWLASNSDRVLFGVLKSNNAANVHATSLLNVDNTSDKLTTDVLSQMKRMALEASPKIRPIRIEGDKRFFVAFCGTRTFRDLKKDTVIVNAQRETIIAPQANKLFQGGDLNWDGIIVHEIDDIPTYTGVGAGGIDVQPVYLCGAQALGMAWARRWKSNDKEFDYGDKFGVSMSAIYNAEKLMFGTGTDEDTADPTTTKQNGIVTGYMAAVADA